MKKELKIIIGNTSTETKVFLGDKQIGLIQEIKISARAGDNQNTDVEITFPDFGVIEKAQGNINDWQIKIDKIVEELKEFANVKIKLANIWKE